MSLTPGTRLFFPFSRQTSFIIALSDEVAREIHRSRVHPACSSWQELEFEIWTGGARARSCQNDGFYCCRGSPEVLMYVNWVFGCGNCFCFVLYKQITVSGCCACQMVFLCFLFLMKSEFSCCQSGFCGSENLLWFLVIMCHLDTWRSRSQRARHRRHRASFTNHWLLGVKSVIGEEAGCG